jgi:hypothetical protein
MRKGRKKLRAKETVSPHQTKTPIEVSFYCVAFIDVLNQTEVLRRISKFPESGQEKRDFNNLWSQSVGRIRLFRDLFARYFDPFVDYKPPVIPGATVAQVNHMRTLGTSEIKKQLFSDSMIYYVSISGTSQHTPIVGVYALMQACAGVFLACLSQRFICRGGIEVGIAGEFFQNEIYGPALYQAHRLESVEAQYPRIVVGRELYRFITTVINGQKDSDTDAFQSSIAGICERLVCTDADGLLILDYAGGETKRQIESTNPTGLPKMKSGIEDALGFVDSEWQRFRHEQNIKLAARYFLLHNYLSDRKERFWK